MGRKEKITLWLVLIAGIVLLLGSCGDYRGPGTDNIENTGNILVVNDIMPQDRGEDTYDIDIVQHICPSGEPEDPLTDATLRVELYYEKGPACSSDIGKECPNINILSYRVEFFSDNDSAYPLPDLNVITQNIHLSPDSSVELEGLLLIPVSWKDELATKGDPSEVIVYQVKVTFYGVTDYGYEVKTWAQTFIEVADWDVCQ